MILMDIDVRSRFSAMRRSMIDLKWSSQVEGLKEPVANLPFKFFVDDLDLQWSSETVSPASLDSVTHSKKENFYLGQGSAASIMAGSLFAEGDTLISLADTAKYQVISLNELKSRFDGKLDSFSNLSIKAAIPLMEEMCNLVREVGMTALNTSLASVRASAATRGFAAVARDIEGFSDQVAAVSESLEAGAFSLDSNSNEIGAMAATLRFFAEELFEAAKSEKMRCQAEEPLDETRKRSLLHMTGTAIEAAGRIGNLGLDMADIVEDLTHHLRTILRHVSFRNKRETFGYVSFRSCRLIFQDGTATGRALDISPCGSLISLDLPHTFSRGQSIQVEFDRIGLLHGTIASIIDNRIQVSFDDQHPFYCLSEPALKHALKQLHIENETITHHCSEFANDVTAAFEAGLYCGDILLQDLLSKEYEYIPGTIPQHYRAAASVFYEDVLPFVLKDFFVEPCVAYAVITDRNGYVPVHNPPYSLKPTANVTFDTRFSRNRRIYDDWSTLRAARNLRPSLIQICRWDVLEGKQPSVKEVSVPVFIKGRHWGCAQIGFHFKTDEC